MSFFSSEVESLVDVFQCEATDLIKELDNDLEQIQEKGTLDADVVNGIFRVVHTIKSSSAMMGLDRLSQGTHRLEDLFRRFRDDLTLCQGNEKRIVDVLYDYADYVRDETEAMSDEDYQPSSMDALMEEVEKNIAFFNDPGKKEEVRDEKEVSEEKENPGLILHVRFKESCPLVNVRAVLLTKQIQPVCSSLTWEPENLEGEDAAARLLSDGLTIHAHTQQPDKVKGKFQTSPYVESVETVTDKDDETSLPVKEMESPQTEEQLPKVEEASAEIKTNKFCSLPWERIVRLQKITEELIVSHTLLENMVSKMDNSRELESYTQSLKRTLGELEQVVDAVALTPVSSVKTQLNRIVRDICKKENKEVEFKIQGEEIEADKNLIDMMLNPLMHVIRNAIDHGIESAQERVAQGKDACGQVTLSVSSSGSMLLFSVSDDGRGIDSDEILESAIRKNLLRKDRTEYTRDEIINLITLPGFSTTKKANEFSGRGVGMDVVRSSVESLGGALIVKSEKGLGSIFRMQVPVSMTAVDSMCFLVGDTTCLIPMTAIEHIYALDEVREKIYQVDGQEIFQEASLIPVLHMTDVFEVPEEERVEEYVFVLKGIKSDLCIVTGNITGQQTAVMKKLPSIFKQEYGGETGIQRVVIIGDGALGMMLNTEKLIEVHRKGQRI